MSVLFGNVPSTVIGNPEPFSLQISDQDLEDFKALLHLSKIGPATWANQQEDRQFGITRQWLANAKNVWLNQFDWRAQEKRINLLPNFRITVKDSKCGDLDLHFIALFSSRKDAVPVIFMHGWPGSFLEFLPMIELLSRKYSPETLPYHVIVPSLPGYGLSSHLPLDREFTLPDAARILNQMMIQLGFGAGYVAQGGDVGALLSSIMAREYAECKAFHVNLLVCYEITQSNRSTDNLSHAERQQLERMKRQQTTGSGYVLEQGTRPATIGLVLSASPLSMLAWIGEKFLDWPDEPVAMNDILANVSLYWFTSTYPTSLYPYRTVVNDRDVFTTPKSKPLGFSNFPREIAALPRSWAEEACPNLKFYRDHEKGGHFAALECPEALLADVEEFIDKVGRPALSE